MCKYLVNNYIFDDHTTSLNNITYGIKSYTNTSGYCTSMTIRTKAGADTVLNFNRKYTLLARLDLIIFSISSNWYRYLRYQVYDGSNSFANYIGNDASSYNTNLFKFSITSTAAGSTTSFTAKKDMKVLKTNGTVVDVQQNNTYSGTIPYIMFE